MRNKTFSFVLFLLMIFSGTCFAIVNIESLRLNIKPGISGNIFLKGSGASGNSEKFNSSLGSTNAWNWKTSQLFLVSNYQYGESRKVKDTNKVFTHLRFAQDTSISYIQSEFYFQWQFNEFQRLNSRALAGIGSRLSFLANKNWKSYFGAGGFWYLEEIKKTSLSPKDSEDGVRGNFYFTVAGDLSSEMSLFNTVYFQPHWKMIRDHNLLWELLIKKKTTSNLSLTLSWTLFHDNEPQKGTKSSDSSYLIGFSYNY